MTPTFPPPIRLRSPSRRRALVAPLALALAVQAAGCVSTEALYAEYDERICRVAVETSSAGDARVRELGTERTMRWEPLIGFAHDGDVLTESEKRRLDRDVAVLRAYPALRASVRGFTDARGPSAHNRELAERRVRSVTDHLRARGIADERLTEVPLGEGLPLVQPDDGERIPPNRRVELLLTDAEGLPLPLLVRPVTAGADDGTAVGRRAAPTASGGTVDAGGAVDGEAER